MATDQDRKALDLRKAGATADRIADTLDFPNPAAVTASLHESLTAAAYESLDDTHRLELERLDAMQRALWPRAMGGEWLAIDRCLAIMERRANLLGLDGKREEQPERDRVDDLADRREARRAKTQDLSRS